MSEINGLSFGGNVWSYGSVDAFKADFEAAQKAQGGTVGSDKTPAAGKPKKAPKEPEDTGLTRYLGSTGIASQKLANLYKINKFVDDFRLNSKNGDLPEAKELKELSGSLSPDKLAQKILGGSDGVRKTGETLARMLGEKTLAARRKVQGQETCSLSATEQTNIQGFCSTALKKTFQAYSLDRLSRLMSNDDPVDHAKADKDVLLNTALGVAELLMDGRITGDSVVTLLRDGSLADLANTLDVTVLLHRAAVQAKEQFTKKGVLEAASKRSTGTDKEVIDAVIRGREKFANVLDFQIHEHDPSGKLDDKKFLPKQLEEVKLRLQQFRYDLERCTGEVGKEFGHGKYSYYGIMEKLRRACSNLKGDRHLDVRFKTNADRVQAYKDLEKAETSLPEQVKGDMKGDLKKCAEDACKTTHDANDLARMSQETAAARRAEDVYANKVLDVLEQTGGMQMVATEISVSAVAQIGNQALVGAQVAVGGFYKTSAAVAVGKGGGYSLILAKIGGGRVSTKAGAGADSVKVQASAEGAGGKETVLSFGSREELLAYCRQNCPKLIESIPGSFTDIADRKLLDKEALTNLKKSVGWVGGVVKAGKLLGNVMGLRIHKTKNFTEAGFENRARNDGYLGQLDGILYRRRNGLAASRTQSSTASGQVSASASADVGVASLSGGGALGGSTKKAVTKVLKSATAISAMHTADELKETLVADEFNAFAEYQNNAPEKYRKSELADKLRQLVDSEPQKGAKAKERAKFWSDALTAISTGYKTLESGYSTAKLSKKEVQALQVAFARQTRLCAIVNEYVAKRIESELSSATSPDLKSSLQNALKFSRESLGATLAHSNIVLKPDVVQQHLQFGREVSGGKSREFSVQASVGWDVGIGKSSGSGSSDAATGEATNAAVSVFKNAFMGAMGTMKADGEATLKGLMALTGKISGKLTVKTYAERGDTVQPWANANSLQVSLDVTYPLGPLSLIETVVKLVEKAKADKPKDAKWTQMLGQVSKDFALELGKQMGATALNELDKAAAKLVQPVTSLPVALLMGGVTKALQKVGLAVGISSTDTAGSGATLALTFQGGKLTQCKMSDYVSSTKGLQLSAKAAALPFGLTVSKTDTRRREQVTFDTMPRATLGTVLQRAGGFRGPSGDADFKNFLLKNQKGVNGLMKELRATEPNMTVEPGKSVYKSKSLQAILDGLKNVKTLAATSDTKVPGKMKAAAANAYDAAVKAWKELAKAPSAGENDSNRDDLLITLSKSLQKAYGLLGSAQGLGWNAPKG